ncbi:cysteine synthase family protein [bacterium M00.F.Ca.ET.228.01.1.1]|nr:cysteine synthase family protein [bacterium M00.F.Ca.ET.228.01.1.1]TGR95277.1 cysteine synthase family protein [bacterium M00.F.Ca.ET.191.01.1.1]TGT96126.1 cysteine synthase family protein [bacterium M00.F.Ca.ET.155.01.1.1]
MKASDSVIDIIGNTPLVRIRKHDDCCPARLYAKLEFMNPGGSVKDRLAKYLVSRMERDGSLTADSVLVENSSGNTGAALSMVAAVRGLRCVVTIPDKMSREKIARMRAFGTEVVIAPTAVDADDPRSYYSLARQLANEIPNAVYPDQYNNPLNALAHYESTGPEIWEQTGGAIDAFVCGIGTGGTISGVGRYLKEQNPRVQVIGVDPIGSVFHDYFHYKQMSKPHVYDVEGIGEDYLVKAVDFTVIDDIVQVNDAESFAAARRLVREEGILCGGSSGSALSAALQVAPRFAGRNVVVLLPDSGNMYLSKFLDDEWMAGRGHEVDPRPPLMASGEKAGLIA